MVIKLTRPVLSHDAFCSERKLQFLQDSENVIFLPELEMLQMLQLTHGTWPATGSYSVDEICFWMAVGGVLHCRAVSLFFCNLYY